MVDKMGEMVKAEFDEDKVTAWTKGIIFWQNTNYGCH